MKLTRMNENEKRQLDPEKIGLGEGDGGVGR